MHEFERLAARRFTDAISPFGGLAGALATGAAAWNEKPVSSVWV